MELRFIVAGLAKATLGNQQFVQLTLRHEHPARQHIAPNQGNIGQMVTYVTEEEGRHFHIDQSFVARLEPHNHTT